MQSSANTRAVDLRLSGRWFMYIRFNKGPTTAPCGTPEKTWALRDAMSSRTTELWRQDKTLLIHDYVSPHSLQSRRWWRTMSNALLKSRMMASKAACTNWRSKVLGGWNLDCSFLNPCCKFDRRQQLSRWFMIDLWTMCSSNFDAIEVRDIGR